MAKNNCKMEGARGRAFTLRKTIAPGEFPSIVELPGVVKFNVRLTVGGEPLPINTRPISIQITGNLPQPHPCHCCPSGGGATPTTSSENESLKSTTDSPAYNSQVSAGCQTEQLDGPAHDSPVSAGCQTEQVEGEEVPENVINLDRVEGLIDFNGILDERTMQVNNADLDSNVYVCEDSKLSESESSSQDLSYFNYILEQAAIHIDDPDLESKIDFKIFENLRSSNSENPSQDHQDIDQREGPGTVPVTSSVKWVLRSHCSLKKRIKEEEKVINEPIVVDGGVSGSVFDSNENENPKLKDKKRKIKKNCSEKTKSAKKTKSAQDEANRLTDWKKAPRNLKKLGKAEDEDHWYVERILDARRKGGKGNQRYFLVKWFDWPEQYNSWEPEENFYPRIEGQEGEAFDHFITSRQESAKAKNKWNLGDELHQPQSSDTSFWDK